MRFETKVVHGVNKNHEMVKPLHLSTICSQKIPGQVVGFEYSRFENPTRTLVEKELAFLESAQHAILFSSGMAAITSVLSTLRSGDHVICSKNVYDGTLRVLKDIFAKFGVHVSFIQELSELGKNISKNTKLVWFESVSNPLLEVIDVRSIKETMKGKNQSCKLVIDSTFSTPFCIKPLELGADIVIHSTTKFLSGHHDTLGGVVLTNNEDLQEKIKVIQQTTGNMLSPFDCFLLSRGIKTFNVRMERQCENAKKLVAWLEEQPTIKKVIFPGLKSHPGHSVAREQARAFGAMISIEIKAKDLDAVVKKLRLVKISQSLGGFGTIIQIPRKMMDLSLPEKELDRMGITQNFVRISVGLEHVDDIIWHFVGNF